jgi:hypothetical protein
MINVELLSQCRFEQVCVVVPSEGVNKLVLSPICVSHAMHCSLVSCCER